MAPPAPLSAARVRLAAAPSGARSRAHGAPLRRAGDLLCRLIRISGVAWLVRHLLARRRVSIVLYHDPDPLLFRSQLTYLGRRYSLIGIDRLVAALADGAWAELPPRPLIVQLDDGRAGNLELLDSLEGIAGRATLYLCPDRLGEAAMLTEAQARALAAVTEVGSHTLSHPRLPLCSEATARREIAESRVAVERISGAPCTHLAFPHGQWGEREVELAREAGYRSARTVDVGWVGPRADPLRLRLLSIDPPSIDRLAAELTGFKWLSRLVNREGRLDGRRRWGRSRAP